MRLAGCADLLADRRRGSAKDAAACSAAVKRGSGIVDREQLAMVAPSM